MANSQADFAAMAARYARAPAADTSRQSVSMAALGPLPEGWEERYTPDGKKYFVHHATRSTHWEDPREKKDVSSSELPNGWEVSCSRTTATTTTTTTTPAATIIIITVTVLFKSMPRSTLRSPPRSPPLSSPLSLLSASQPPAIRYYSPQHALLLIITTILLAMFTQLISCSPCIITPCFLFSLLFRVERTRGQDVFTISITRPKQRRLRTPASTPSNARAKVRKRPTFGPFISSIFLFREWPVSYLELSQESMKPPFLGA
jgi:hypothetical protein